MEGYVLPIIIIIIDVILNTGKEMRHREVGKFA